MEGFVVAVILVTVGIAIFAVIYNQRWRERDRRISEALSEGVRTFLSERAATAVPSWREVREYEGLRLGEVTRHFDSNTAATINGWLTHELGFHGWAVGGTIGRVGLGVGRLGLSGASEVNLTSSGTTRDDLMGDGFIAVFEQDTPAGADTLRVVVPSEQATREWVDALLDTMLARFTTVDTNGKTRVEFPQSHATLRRLMPDLLRFENEASYISDRLHSVLRMPPESRPQIAVYGHPLSDHALVGAAIQIGSDDRMHLLFPGDLVKTVPQLVDQAFAAARRPAEPA